MQWSSPRGGETTQALEESPVSLINKYNLIWTKMTKVMEADLIVKMGATRSLLSSQSVWLSKVPK